MSSVRALRFAAIVLTLAILIIGGFYIFQWHRQIANDERREHDILSLSWRLIEYDHANGVLPKSLEEIKKKGEDEIPRDPKNGRPYEYRRMSKKVFQLCATFSKQSKEFATVGSRVMYGDPITHGYGTWSHGKGHQCIDRTVPEYR